MNKKLSIAITLCGAAGSFSAAQAAVTCGAVITTSETMTSSLTCTTNPALTVQGPGSLNMGGNTLTCGSAATGIRVTGSRATVENGTITKCQNGLSIAVGAGHTVRTIRSQSNGGHGFEVIGKNNKLTSNSALNNGIMGFEVKSGGNTFNQNTVNASGKDGYNIFGDNNVLTSNTSVNVLHDGIDLKPGSTGNTVSGNNVSGSGTSRINAFDLKDENANCGNGTNKWSNNTGTFNQPCIDGSSPPPTGSPGVLQFTALSYNVGEGNGSATVTVSRTDGSTGPVSVTYTTGGGTATDGADYTFTSGALNWADGDASNKTFTVPIIDDGDVEDTETVGLSLSNPDGGATLGARQTANLRIADNETVSGGATCAGRTATIVGTEAADIPLTGTVNADVIAGLGGNDEISGRGGADIICAGAGDDSVAAGAGDDQLLGEDGNDRLDGSEGVDSCDGGAHTTGDRALNCETTTGIP